jgi:HEAT repeat protein
MDKQLQTIAALLGSEVPNRRLAAAIVLGELAPSDPDVVRALGSALGSADETLTREIVAALGRTRHKTAFPYLLPMLLNAPPALRDAAAKALAQLKMDIEAELEKVWAKAATQQKLALMDVFARLHSDGATRFLLTGLFDPDFEMVKSICGAIRRHISDASEEERKDLFKQISSFVKSPRVKKDMRATTSCLILFGSLGNPAARPLLLDYIGPKQVAFVRRNALQALAGLSREGAGVDAMIKKVLPLLKEEDRENVVSPAIALLAPLEFPANTVGDLEKLAKSDNAEVRRFAVRKLGYQTGKKIVGSMLDWLSDADQEVRDIAAKALCRIEDAAQPLLEKLGKVSTADDAWNIVKLLKPHAERFAKDAKKKLAARCLDLLEKNDPRVPAYTWLLRNVDAAGFNAQIAEAGEDLRQRKKFAAAVQSLRLLANTEFFNAAVRYQLSFSGLKTSSKDLAPGRRGEDPCLRGFTALLRDPSFKLFDGLAKDKKLLEPEDLFYLGFHFAESPMGHEQQFSKQVFEFLIKTWPKSEQAKAAKNKLKTEGKNEGASA